MRETLFQTVKSARINDSSGEPRNSPSVATPSERCRKNTSYDTQDNLDGDASSEVGMSDSDELFQRAKRMLKERHIKEERAKTAAYRSAVLERQEGYCHLCSRYVAHVMQLHHIKPLEKLGLTTLENIVGLCPTCHAVLHSIAWTREDEKISQLVTYFDDNHTPEQVDEFYRLSVFLADNTWDDV